MANLARSGFESQRHAMVERQLAARGITDVRVLQAMDEVPRELFLPPEQWSRAYDDEPVSLGAGSTISQPYMVALMAQRLELTPADVVLEVGGGCGYAAAIYARLAQRVISLEIIPELAAQAEVTLRGLGVSNLRVIWADGSRGCAEESPFDAISVAAAAPEIPPVLLEQMREGGRLVMPVGPENDQNLMVVRRTAGGWNHTQGAACRFVPLRVRPSYPSGSRS